MIGAKTPSFWQGLSLRGRLLRKVGFRLWKATFLGSARSLIQTVRGEGVANLEVATPAVVLTTFERIEDFLILSYLFRNKQLTFVAPKTLPEEGLIESLRAANHVIPFGEGEFGYPLFRSILTVLRDFNRSVVISPEAAARYASHVTVDPSVVVRITMKANVPIIPVALRWRPRPEDGRLSKSCDVWVGRKIFISPRAQEFRDVFFRTRGARKFEKLAPEDSAEIGQRVFSVLDELGRGHGPNLP